MRWVIIILIFLGVGLIYLLSRPPEPTFDLDRFNQQIFKLRAAYSVAKKVADTDTIPEQLELDLDYLHSVGKLLEQHLDQCQTAAQALKARQAQYIQDQKNLPSPVTIEKIETLERLQRLRQAQKTVAILAPAWFDLAPIVNLFTRSCPQESQILSQILGTMPQHQTRNAP